MSYRSPRDLSQVVFLQRFYLIYAINADIFLYYVCCEMRYLISQYMCAILLTIDVAISSLILLVNRCFSFTSRDLGLFFKVEIILMTFYIESNHTHRSHTCLLKCMLIMNTPDILII